MKRLLLAALLAAPAAQAAGPLPSFDVDPADLTVSGISSGAYMAGQFHVAFSDRVAGAALVAGGPYGCAEGAIAFALQRCMETNLGDPDPAALLAEAQARARAGAIAPLGNLADDPVYVFSGTQDRTLLPEVAADAVEFYRRAGAPQDRLVFRNDMAAGHGFIVETPALPCGASEAPFINDCDHDQAGAILTHLLGPLNPPAPPAGRIVEFDQAEHLADPTAHGMALTGFAYVPAACEAGGCRLHVAFHGCRQSADLIGDKFLAGAGYNRWAEANDLIVLYPQAHATERNPRSCWDWWGYDDPAYATRAGRQMVAVAAMIDRLEGRTPPPADFCARFAAGNLVHWKEGRARACGAFFQSLCAVGSGEEIGYALGETVLFEHPEGHFTTSACAG